MSPPTNQPPRENPADFPDAEAAPLPGARTGERESLDRLFPLVYEELRRIAHLRLAAEPSGHTLDTTGLVHEAYLKLVDQTRVEWKDRPHFLAVASMAMRRILVDHARKHRAAKRGGVRQRIPLDAVNLSVEDRAETLLELDGALTRLAEIDQRMSKVVECRFFGGMTEEETAEALGVTSRTVRSDWATAKGLLYLELSGPDVTGP
jgi:RNA polymerase sigma factor (TIGR02999 family)